MKTPFYKKAIPHIIAVVVFLIIAVIYCRPALEGKVLQQHDIVSWKGMAQNTFEYKERNGHFPLWNTYLFSGMPNYQISIDGKSFLPNFHAIITLGLPKPISFFFLACVCFYILCQVLRMNYLVSILCSLAFAYCTYDPVIISVGHESKMVAIAYMPGVLAGLFLIYQKKYWPGLAVTAFFATWEIAYNHPQITYYLLIAIAIITLGFVTIWIKAREWKHTAIALSLAALAAFIAFANCSITLLTTREYAQYTMRGGKTIDINGTDIKKVDTKGLDPDYAFQYSFGKGEFLTFLMPYAYGGSSGEVFEDDSKLVTVLTDKNIPESDAVQLAASLPKYWGGIEPSTSGPVYFGAIIFILAIISLIVVKNEIRWWILGAVIFTLFMSWGSYLPWFNNFLFNNLPLYNKFRAPSMSLVIPQLLMPLLAGMALQQIFFTPDTREQLQKSLKPLLYAIGGIFLTMILVYIFNDFSGGVDKQIMDAYGNPQSGNPEIARTIVNALKEARKAMFTAGFFRVLGFAALVIGLIYMYLKNIIKPAVAIIIFLLVNTIDLFAIGSKYLNSDSFIDPETYQSDNFAPTAVDQQILNDKDPHFRVFNLSPDRFNDAVTSYHHRSVGGYHAAKLSLYQDLIAAQLSRSPLNMPVLNMLDTRYFIIPASQQQPTASLQKNEEALGAAWFVKNITYVNGAVEEIKALDNFNPKDTAYLDISLKPKTSIAINADSTASIKLVKYDNDAIQYSSSAKANQFAVFSEIYYPAGWNAYIDGNKAEYVKTDYLLRGMEVPAGNHTIDFKFEPASYSTGQQLSYVGNALFWLAILMAGLALWKQRKKTEVQ